MCLLNYFRSLFGLRLIPSCKGQFRERRSPLHVWEDALNIPHGYWPLALHILPVRLKPRGGRDYLSQIPVSITSDVWLDLMTRAHFGHYRL